MGLLVDAIFTYFVIILLLLLKLVLTDLTILYIHTYYTFCHILSYITDAR